jgi:hypothetical protein
MCELRLSSSILKSYGSGMHIVIAFFSQCQTYDAKQNVGEPRHCDLNIAMFMYACVIAEFLRLQ